MKSVILFVTSLFFIILTLVLNLFAHHFYLYWQTGWIDGAAHLFGALGATLFLFWISRFYKNSEGKITFLFSLAYVLFIGLVWEIFEYNFGLITYSSNYIPDTITDLAMDCLGGVIGYGMVKYLFNLWQKN